MPIIKQKRMHFLQFTKHDLAHQYHNICFLLLGLVIYEAVNEESKLWRCWLQLGRLKRPVNTHTHTRPLSPRSFYWLFGLGHQKYNHCLHTTCNCVLWGVKRHKTRQLTISTFDRHWLTWLLHGSLYRIWNMGTIIIFEYLDRYSSIDLMPERIALQQQHNTCPIFWINVSHSHWKTKVLVTVVSLSTLCIDPWNHAPRARPFVRIQCEVYANRIVSRHVSRVACPRYNPLNNFPNIQNDPIQDLLHCSARGHTIYRTGTKIYILRNWWQHNDAKLFLQIYIYTVCRIFVSKSNK